jgi:ATP-binding protein involved in chromosome partitioning
MGAIQQLLYEVAWNKGGDLDVLVIDMPPGTGDAQITLSQRVPLAGAVIVSTPQDIALIDAAKGIDMFQKVNVPILGIVENMSYFLCPHCGERSDIFGHGGARETAGRLGAPFLGEVPLHISIRETSDSGNPIVISAPKSAEALAYMGIAEKVALALAQAAGGRTPPPITFE